MSKNRSDWKNCESCIFYRSWADTGGCPFAYDKCDGKNMYIEYKQSESKMKESAEETDGIDKKKKFTIRMDVTMNKEMSFEEAERVIFSALRSAGMTGHCGGIY